MELNASSSRLCYLKNPVRIASRKDKNLALNLISISERRPRSVKQLLRDELNEIENINANITRKSSRRPPISSSRARSRSKLQRASRSALLNRFITAYDGAEDKPDHGHITAQLTLAWHNSYSNIHKKKKIAQAHAQLKSAFGSIKGECGRRSFDGTSKYCVTSFSPGPTSAYSGKSYTTSGHPLRQMTSADDISEASSILESKKHDDSNWNDAKQFKQLSVGELYGTRIYSGSRIYSASPSLPKNHSLIKRVSSVKTGALITTGSSSSSAKKMWKKFKEKIKKKR